MKASPISVLLVCLLTAVAACVSSERPPDLIADDAIFSNAGWSQSRLDEAFALAEHYGTGTLIVMTDGKVIRSTGDVCQPHRVHSVRKALLGALVGQHVGSGPGRIDLDATLAQLGIDDRPHPLTALQQQATVLHLIKSVSGINHAAAGEIPSMTARKRKRLGTDPNQPGTVWAYNNWDYNALTTIFEQSTGLSVYEAFLKGIARPLGMREFNQRSVFYSRDETLSMHAKAGFRMSARDLARFGQLYLNMGRWEGRQIIPASWIEGITTDYTITDRNGLRSGHGYLWWVPCDPTSKRLGIPPGTFYASGFGGQKIVVLPAWETVIVHTVVTDDYFGFCADWARQRGLNLDQAATYSRTTCRMPAHRDDPFCRRCRYYSGGDFQALLEKIIEARSDR